MTINSGIGVHGSGSQDPAGQATALPAVRIDRDVLPAWEDVALPDWVVYWLIPMLSAGQKWPEASESGLSKLAQAYDDLAEGAIGSTPDAGFAARVIVTGWAAPPTADFVSRVQFLYGHEGGMAGVSGNARAYSQQASNFAVETQYSKLSINVCFKVALVAIAIAFIAAFFTAGSATAIVGPYAAAARAAISRILVRLATLGGRQLSVQQLARVTTLSGATGQGLLARLLSTSMGRELVEEIGEEFFIDAIAQYQQMQMGTRQTWDWLKSQAAIIGAGAGTVVGTKLAGPVSQVTTRVPGFAGRALTTGLTNTIASPFGSFIANGAVYGQWQNPFTADALMGGFLGGAGRTGTISPFSPDVYTALTNPLTSLASAYDAAARADARMAGNPPPDPVGANPSGGGPSGGGGQPSMSGSAREPDAVAPTPARTGGTTASPDPGGGRPGTASSTPGRDDDGRRAAPAPDPETASPRRGSTLQPTGEVTPQPEGDAARTPGDPPRDVSAAEQDRPAHSAATPTQPDGPASEPESPTAQHDEQPTPSDEQPARPDERPAQADEQPTQLADQTTVAASAPVAEPMTATVRARTALIGALSADFPGAVIGPTGDLLISTPDGVRAISAATMSRIRAALDTRAEEVQDLANLQAEAAAMLTVASAGETTTQADPAPDDGRAAEPAYTSKPGTVTSRPVPGTRYVPDGRQGPDLDLDEVRNAVGELLADHFLGQDVTGFSWSPDGRTLAVHTKTHGTQFFRPVIGGLSPDLMGQTKVKAGTDENHPHLVHFGARIAPGQVSRVWLHEITDTLQEVQSAGHGKRRKFLPGRRRTATQDACVAARFNELAFLTHKWRQAPTLQEKRLLAVDIDGVARELSGRGHTPPLPPWAPTQATRPQRTPALPGDHSSAQDVQSVIDALVQAEQAIQQQIDAKRSSRDAAREQAKQATRRKRKALRQHDQGRFKRAGDARQEHQAHRATQKRHTRIANAYATALARAMKARLAYEQVLAAMNQAGGPTQPGEVNMTTVSKSLTAKATRLHQSYLNALAAALPQEDSLSTAMPTGRLPHLTTLTTTVNEILGRNGAGHKFTPDELERALRADFHKAVSPDGVVLRVGRGRTAAEIRVRLSLTDLAEVLDPAVRASEMMVGLFFQSARTVSATESSSGVLPLGLNTTVLAQLLPDNDWRALATMVGVGLGAAAGRNSSASGGAGMFAQGGSVADNRSESLLFDAAATWTVEVRTGKDVGWRETTVVDSGAPGDAASQRLWISHSYTDQPPRKLARIDDAKRDPKLPNHVISGMTGLEDALGELAAALGGEYTEVGAVAHDELRMFVTDELPHRLRDAVNTGLDRVFTKDGEPHARVRAETRVVLVETEPLGGPSAEEWEEEVLVDFVAVPGGASSGGSLEGKVSAGFTPTVDGPGSYEPSFGPKVKGSRSASRSYPATANRQAIHPSVHRKTSPKQSYRLALETTFIVETFGKPPVKLTPMRGTAVLSMRESAAYRFGLPVDSSALMYQDGRPLTDADGNQVLRGDPLPTPPPGRKAELPDWLGDGPGKMRGAGPALVQDISGLEEVRQKALDKLADRGIVPKIVNGVPQYSSNRLERASQILNLQEVTEQLSEHRIRSAYDSLAQDGILVDLVLHGLNSAPKHFMMRISLKQDFGDSRYIGYTESETVVNLDIGSDTSARSVSRSRTYSGGLSLVESDGPGVGQNGLSHEASINAGGDRKRTAGSNVGSTVNVVTLQESTGPVAIFSLAHELSIELLHDGESTPLASGRGRAKLLFAADLLPPETGQAPAPLGKMSSKLLSSARLLHMDVRDLLPAAERVLPRGMRPDSVAYQTLTAFLNVRNLVAHPKLLSSPLTTDLAIRTRGLPTRSKLSVAGEVGEAEVLCVVDQVNGDILFGLASAGVSWGGSSGHSAGASTNLTDLNDGGKSSNGGTLSLPSRSGGTADSTSILDIWGSEELTIEFGRQYIVRAPVDLTLTGSESATRALPLVDSLTLGETLTDTAQGTALFSLPEFDALLMYAEGELALPGALVGDAVERFLNGSLTLDRSLAVPLVQRYLKDMAQAGPANPGFARRHTPRNLLAKIREVAGLGPAATTAQQGNQRQQLDQTLSEAADLIERSRDVVIAPSYDRAMGVGAAKSLDFTDEQGNPVNIRNAVQDAVRAAAPEALDGSPTLSEELDVDFSSDSARIHVTDMWSKRGYEKSYLVQAGPQVKRAEELTVRARLVYTDAADSRRGTLLTHTSQSGVIVQHYRYVDRSHSEAYNGSYSAGLDHSAADEGDGRGMGASTDRGRGYSGSVNQQDTRLKRMSVFNGLNRVRQEMTLVIEVERRPVRGAIPAKVDRWIGVLRGRRRTAPPVTYGASLVRSIPTGMIRPVAEDPGPLVVVPDPRQVELHPGHFPQALWEDPHRPSLFEVVTAQFGKMLGAETVEEQRPELVARLSPSALLTGFERMAGAAGDTSTRVTRQKFKDQGAEVTIQARTSDLTIVAGPFEAERGEVDRKADAQNATVSRSRLVPVGMSTSASDGGSGLDGSVRAGEQASESVTDHHGARRERSMFEKGTAAYTVRLRVDYDLTFQHVARLRDGSERAVGDPAHLPSAAGSQVDVTLYEDELEELRSRMESNVRLAPPRSGDPGWTTFTFVPGPGSQRPIQVLQAARLAARERGAVARVAVREADGLHRYRAAPDGTVHSETPDGGFAEAFATLSPALLDAADRAGLNLRHVFMSSAVPGTFARQVEAALTARRVPVADPDKPAWPAHQPTSSSPVGGSVAQGITSVTSPAIEGTPFSRSGRPAGDPDLTLAEVRAQHVFAADVGGAGAHLSWSADDQLTLQLPAVPDQHVRVLIGDPGEGFNATTELHAGTEEDPHVMRVWPRVHPDAVSSLLVHELSHVTQAAAATAAGAPQGVIRTSLSDHQAEGTDLCLTPRLDEHAHLSRKWRAATDPAVRSRLADAIDAISADIERRGHTPPSPPWGTGPRAPAAAQPQSPIEMLLNAASPGLDASEAGLARLAEVAGVAPGTPASSP
ncbi:hypothetical protein ETD86_28695 [Nonomuraea turkmeniaca]|uniref:Outer membrane channel protein CpnT-like N-terminal domain-containing protein n=1 Tax=Nonomuraea turkmeniaca TaxID=103838 RepID=A0A5S4FAY4_9ACTN|nr:hypothetical protein [Nonomuraea turkmeniaca]TMR14399.1 hypothetical protein ETD86_28695 [Nonomuraea turkmeniaca]